MEAVQTLGYQPNRAARTLARGKTGTVALWVPNACHSVFSQVIEQIMRLAREASFSVVIVHINTETRESLAQRGLISGWNMDAILAFDARDLVNEIVEVYPDAPTILSFGPTYSTRVDHVGVDLRGGSLLAVRHLLEMGCRRVAMAGVEAKMRPGDSRYDAYMQVMYEADMEPELIPLAGADYAQAYEGFRRHFSGLRLPDGLFCWNDETAISANRALADLGVRVPDEVAVIGSDGIRETEYVVPSMSTVAQSSEEMCRLAWEFLQRRLADPKVPIQGRVLPMELETCASTVRG